VNAHWDHDWLDYETCPLRKTEVHSIYHHYLCDAEHAWLVGNESCTSEYIQSICLSNPCVLCLTIFIPQQFLIINEIHWKKLQHLITLALSYTYSHISSTICILQHLSDLKALQYARVFLWFCFCEAYFTWSLWFIYIHYVCTRWLGGFSK